jgi:hypothetical protein
MPNRFGSAATVSLEEVIADAWFGGDETSPGGSGVMRCVLEEFKIPGSSTVPSAEFE